MEVLGFEAELGEGLPQSLLGDGELSELIGQRLSQLGHVIVALPVVLEQLQARLQVQVHRTGAPAHPLSQSLPGALWWKRRVVAHQLAVSNGLNPTG